MPCWRIRMSTKFCARFRSECRGSIASRWSSALGRFPRLACSAFAAVHVFPQDCVDVCLVAFSALAEEGKHIGIEAQGNLFLWAWPEYCSCEEIWSLLWNIGKVDILVSKRINSLPVRSGAPSRIVPALHDPPLSEMMRIVSGGRSSNATKAIRP